MRKVNVNCVMAQLITLQLVCIRKYSIYKLMDMDLHGHVQIYKLMDMDYKLGTINHHIIRTGMNNRTYKKEPRVVG